MNVELLTSSASVADMENFAALAALTCHANTDKEFVPAEVLGRIIKAGHESILEHINLTYSIKGISRALLQEVARHRHISLSVESTRHTLHKYMAMSDDEILDFFEKYSTTLPTTLNEELTQALCGSCLGVLRSIKDMPNDELKYYLPEFWPVNLVLTSNVRELRHILDLRTAPAALKEFRDLARAMYEAIPEQYKYLLEDCVHNEADNDID